MKLLRLFLVGSVVALITVSSGQVVTAQNTNNSFSDAVMKVYAYTQDPVFGIYKRVSMGSAVLINENQVLTNAHVVNDEEDEPYGFYELCKTESVYEPPHCFTYARLVKYDDENDLAVLEFDENIDGTPVTITDRAPEIGDMVTIHGYPSNGGETLTVTNGRISGFEQGMIKMDANLDAGNSGGGAFDDEGHFIGVPTFVIQGYTVLGYLVSNETVSEFLDGNDSTTVWTENVDSNFIAQLRKNESLYGKDTITLDGYSFGGFSKRGFSVKEAYEYPKYGISSVVLTNTQGTSEITISRSQHENEADKKDRDTYFEKEIAEGMFDVVKSVSKNIKGVDRELSFIAGGEDNKDFKGLGMQTILEDGSYLEYIIMTESKSLKGFVDGIVLFLKGFNVTDVENSLSESSYDMGRGLLDVTSSLINQELSVGQGGSISYTMNVLGSPSMAASVSITTIQDGAEMLQETTFEEFFAQVNGFFSLGGDTQGVIKTKGGTLFYIYEIQADDNMSIWNLQSLVLDGEDVILYNVAIILWDNTKDLTLLFKMINSFSLDGDSPFESSESESSTIQEWHKSLSS